MTQNKALEALGKIDLYYGISDGSICNGCEHGFKPASSCPNVECEHKRAVDAFETIRAALKSPPECIEGLDKDVIYRIILDGLKELTDMDIVQRIALTATLVTKIMRRDAALPHCPDGFVCVPREPTEAMCHAGESSDGGSGALEYCNVRQRNVFDKLWHPENVERIYKAMIAAAEGKDV